MFQVNVLYNLLVFRFKCFYNHLKTKYCAFGIFRLEALQQFRYDRVLGSVQPLHHLQDYFQSDVAESWLGCVDLF